MRIATWNVNSVSARVPRLVEWLEEVGPDVVCLQETKCADDEFPFAAVQALGYEVAVHGLGRWNGVALLSRVGLREVVKGLAGEPGFPQPEPRAIGATCAGVRLWCVYVPHGREPDHPHYAYKLEWLASLREVVARDLADDRPLAVCGDFNVAPTDGDVWDPAEFAHATHVTPAERQALAALRALGLKDVVPRPLKYDHPFIYWDYRAGMFHKNLGMRIDLVYANQSFAAAVRDAYVDRDARKGKAPSDHAPVVVDLVDDELFVGMLERPADLRPALKVLGLPADERRPVAPAGRIIAADADGRLSEYARKRDFSQTPEPAPGPGTGAGDRFVIHEHHATRPHYDLRLERAGVLACWAVPKGLPTAPGEKRLAVKTEDHPLAYADFEGSIPKGSYGAGEMLVVDRGTYESLEWSDAKVSFRLRGARHQGEYHMVKTARGWLVFLAKGQATQPSEVPPEFSPMLPEGGHKPFDDPGWRFEPELDGVRTLAYVSPTATRLVSATGWDQTAQYPELGRLAPCVNAASAVIDGEIIASDEAGRPSSELLGRRMNLTSPQDIEQVRNEVPVKLFAFDLVWLDGADLTGKPLEERRRLLEQIVTEGDPIGLTYFIDGDGRRLFEESRRLGLEGVVAKRLGSPYLPGRRSPDWRTITALAAPLLVVDGPSLLYRAFFALPRTITGPDGQAVNALLGTANLILAAVEIHAPRAVMVCFGAEAAQYRVELYPGYHADRPPMPAELEPQWAAAPAFFDAFGWDVIAHDALEADDLLGSLAAVEAEAGGRALLFTGDRDMFQCVGERVAVLFPTGGKGGPELVDADGVRRRYGIEPEQVPDFIALRGDPSDGLPGARGIGEKTARDLLRVHGSLEGAIAGTLRTRVTAALREDAELLRAFREIARLRRVDLPRPADRPTDFAGAAVAARARGMNRLAERLEASNATPPAQRPRGAPDRLTSRVQRDAAPALEQAVGGQATREGDPDREAMPAGIVPMLASTGALPAAGESCAYEFKWDGVRAIAYAQPGRLRLESRNLNDITGRYPELGGLNDALGSHRVVLDGEIVCFDANGQPSFAALQHRMHIASEARARQLAQTSPVTYVIFDVLWLDGHSLMAQPYAQRREHLAALGLKGEHWLAPDHVVGQGMAMLAASAAQQLEGIIAKRLDSRYEPGRRSGAWVKIKNVGRQEFVIGGWMPGEGRRTQRIGALLLGVHDGGVLRYAGRVGTGFSAQELDRLARLMAPLEREGSPFPPGGPPPPRGAAFCAPELVCEVEFTEWTDDGQLRHPSYKGLRDDKPAAQVVRDKPAGPVVPVDKPAGPVVPEETAKRARTQVQVEGRELVLSNLGKVLYPAAGFTKRDLIDYYAAIAPVLLPHLDGRALTLKRYPDGVEGKAFYEKQAPAHRPGWVQTVSLPSERREAIDYTLAQDLATLVWLANLAALELHTPLARAAAPERPTTLVFDLDPGPPATIVECCHVGLVLQGMFDALGLASFAKTSGSKGLQVYAPLNSDVTFAQTKPFARQVAELLECTEPDLVVSRQAKALRHGKVLIDWSQNDQHKTTVCVYSLRARDRPTVSTPVEWDEVRAALASGDPHDLAFDTVQVLDRVSRRGDLLGPVLSLVQVLPPAPPA